jgi:hypothetical protein
MSEISFFDRTLLSFTKSSSVLGGDFRMKCIFCNKKVELKGSVSRQDSCPHCKQDLRCCKQCNFFDPDAYNQCREVSAERIVDKERANYCDFFMPKGEKRVAGTGYNMAQQDARAALDALFKK